MGDPFENAKKNFGFGFMRLPQKDGEIDLDADTEDGGPVHGPGIQLF